jgi:hypothetical protein
MNATFRFVALAHESFAPLFKLGDAELAARHARRMIVDEKPGFPCRVSLADAEPGETVLLLPFVHHAAASPYRGEGPIFVREGARTARPELGEIPLMFRHRLLSLRAYDETGMMRDAEVVKGDALADAIGRAFGDPRVGYLHLHNAGPGCYNCTVIRA